MTRVFPPSMAHAAGPAYSARPVARRIVLHTVLAGLVGWGAPAAAQITVLSSFNPPEVGGLCGIGFDSDVNVFWVYDCSAASLHSYAADGTFLGAIPRPGESANDVDVEVAPEGLTLGTTALPAGTLLFINGESGPADVYALDKTTGAVLTTLNTGFGVSHVVGGGYSPFRDTFFLVQDLVPDPADENTIAEVHPVTGNTLQTFQITAVFPINFGDLDVSEETGNLFVVSSDESDIAEFTPEGGFVQVHALPSGVSSLSGIALDCAEEEAWVANTSGTVFHLGNVPCGAGEPVLDLTATNTSPLTVAPGGSVSFAYTIANSSAAPATGDLFFTASPGGFSGVIRSGTLPAGATVSGTYTQPIPANAPPGTYTYTLRIGRFPNTTVDQVTFTIRVTSASGRSGGAETWAVGEASPWPGAAPEATSAALPSGHSLHDAYPNPFATQATLRYDVPEASAVRLVVYDLLGREMATLVDGEVEAGTHTAVFDGRDLVAGVYVVRLTAGAHTFTQRITLTR